jgi:O-antigen/teichoic acid export membrane protein
VDAQWSVSKWRVQATRLLDVISGRKGTKGSLRSQTLRGSLITLVGFGMRQCIGLASNLILAYLLFPEAFGLMALVDVILRGLKMFSEVGVGQSIIRHERGDDPAFLNTAWTLQVVRGFGLWIAASALAWPASKLYNAPELAYILPVAAFSSVIAGLNSTASFTLLRSLSWGPMTILGLVAQIASVITMVVVALWTKSVWAFVAGWYAQSIVTAVGSYMIGKPHRHRPAWDRASVHDLLRFGRWIFINTLLLFFAGQFDRLMLGGLLTLKELGVYGLAMSVAMVPVTICAQLAAGVLFPVLASSSRERPGDLAPKVRTARESILTGSLIAVLGAVLGAPVLFGYLYDPRYSDASWIAQGLLLMTWFGILEVSANRVMLVMGNTRSLAACTAIKLVVTAAMSVLGFTYFGLPGFIFGMVAGAFAAHAWVQWTLWKLGIHLVDQDLKYTLLGLGIGLAGTGAAALNPFTPGTAEHLGVLLLIGAVCFVPLAIWGGKKVVKELFKK